MRATLSLQALYDYNGDLFNGLAVPEGVRRQVVINNILLETWDMEVLFPDPNIMQDAITKWAALRLPVWTELQKTQEYEYNPIENYDRRSDITVDRDYDPATTMRETTSGGDTINDYVAGFNSTSSDANTPKEKSVSSLGSVYNRVAGGHDDEVTHTTDRTHGNIGVTTTQQMIQAQREVVEFSTERYIIDDFKRRFCLLIY